MNADSDFQKRTFGKAMNTMVENLQWKRRNISRGNAETIGTRISDLKLKILYREAGYNYYSPLYNSPR